MSEFLVTTDLSGGILQVGHQTKRVVSGAAEFVKTALIAALEELGYAVMITEPLEAKRNASTRAVDKLTRSTIALKVGVREISPAATQLTFDYAVISAALYKGDHATIEREVDAIVALIARKGLSGVCSGCGLRQAADSTFCRACGLRNVSAQPAEIELLRVEATARYGHRANITGMALIFASLLAALPLIFLGSAKAVNVGWALLAMGQVSGLISMLIGSRVVHKALLPKENSGEVRYFPTAGEPAQSAAATGEFPGPLPPAPVTEGTTELLRTETQTLNT